MAIFVNGHKVPRSMIQTHLGLLRKEYEMQRQRGAAPEELPSEEKIQQWAEEGSIEETLFIMEAQKTQPIPKITHLLDELRKHKKDWKDLNYSDALANAALSLQIARAQKAIYKGLKPPTDEAAMAFYKKNRDRLYKAANCRLVSDISIPLESPDEIKSAYASMMNMKQELADDPSKWERTLIGELDDNPARPRMRYLERGKEGMRKDDEDALFALKEDGISDPVLISDSYADGNEPNYDLPDMHMHLFRIKHLESDGEYLPYMSVRAGIMRALARIARNDVLHAHYDALVAAAKIARTPDIPGVDESKMRILVVGGGGREHALAWRLSQDSERPALFCAPGNAGTAAIARNVAISAEDVPALLEWAKTNRPDLTIVGPEVPLCLGIADAFSAEDLRVFGPCKAAAQLEGSKSFAKEIMKAANVPTARAETFTDAGKAIAALDAFGLPVVIKADGLAAGKGVIIAQTRPEAESAIRSMLEQNRFGKAGAEILVEQFLDGEEASILALVDGEHAVLLPSSQDHKRALDGDKGPNTGGMGAYSPAPVVTAEMLPYIKEKIILPVVRELRKRGIVYKGVLYAGLMIGKDGSVNVLEFNVRFGDPETQAVLPRIAGDIIPAFEACIGGFLSERFIAVRPEAAATVVIAAGGYPGPYEKGAPITGLDEAAATSCTVFHAGTKKEGDGIVASGGRILAVSALGKDLREAVANAYAGVRKIAIPGSRYRTDIAHRAFERK